MIRIEQLVIVRNQKRIINSISCTMGSGKVTVLIGKSGAGKTTLLQAIAGLLPIEQGTISIDTKDIRYFSRHERSETIGYVFQQFNLFPHMTALGNCIDPLLVHGMQKQDAKKRALLYFAEFGMQELAEKYPHELSGGQQQRVAIIRALVLQPHTLLLDEPTASLDPNNTNILITILRNITQKGLTVIVSSQDTSFTKKIADAIMYIDNGEMKEYCTSPENLAETQYIKSFLHD